MIAPLRAVPSTRPTVADLQRQADEARRDKLADALAVMADLQDALAEIADRNSGYPVGAAEAARSLLAPLNMAELNIRAIMGRGA